MSSSIFADDALNAASLALKGLESRQQVISNNVANVDTPGYSAKTLDFETTLKNAINSTNTISMTKTNDKHLSSSSVSSTNFTATQNRTGGTYREDGNNVDIETELVDMTDTNIKYQAISQGLSSKLLLLKSIAEGG
jgi:flagellar basal-body rod protein FlgB